MRVSGPGTEAAEKDARDDNQQPQLVTLSRSRIRRSDS